MSEQAHPLRARLLIIGAALFWSTGGAAIKLSSATAPQLAAGRALVAGLVLYLLLPGARLPIFSLAARRTGATRRVLVTAVFYACTCTLYVFANTLTTAGNTIFIQNTAPVWVLILGPLLLGEVSTMAERVSVPICLLGCAMFFFDDLSPGRLAGNLCAAGASLAYALLIISYRKLSRDEGMAATVAGNALIVVVLGGAAVHGPTPGARDLLVFGYLGAVQQALAAALFIRGIKGVSALEGSLLVLLEPLLNPLWAFLLVGERLGPLSLAGATLILCATLWRIGAQLVRRAAVTSVLSAPTRPASMPRPRGCSDGG